MSKKLSYEFVKEFFEKENCKLVSEDYKNAREKLTYICACGNNSEITFGKFKECQRCLECRNRRISASQRYSYDQVKKAFEEQGCELISLAYKNNHEKLRYKCSCGFTSLITFAKFKGGQRCVKCKGRSISRKLSAENSPNWDSTKTENQRIKERKFPEYKDWRKAVYERDDYTCQICGSRGKTINAHHMQSYTKFPELRTVVDNGITLCSDCHKEYHKKIEHNTATLEGWLCFIGEYRDPWYAGEVFE